MAPPSFQMIDLHKTGVPTVLQRFSIGAAMALAAVQQRLIGVSSGPPPPYWRWRRFNAAVLALIRRSIGAIRVLHGHTIGAPSALYGRYMGAVMALNQRPTGDVRVLHWRSTGASS